jgi:hypothetical protein
VSGSRVTDRNERRGAVRELAAEGLSNVAVGQILGVDETTVRRDSANAGQFRRPAEKNNELITHGSAKAEQEARDVVENSTFALCQRRQKRGSRKSIPVRHSIWAATAGVGRRTPPAPGLR